MTKSEDIEEGIVEEEEAKPEATSFWTSIEVVLLLQKIFAELVGSYFLLFIGGGSVAVNKKYGSVSFPGISLCWGLVVMALVYSVGHISGAHFNPAVTVTFAVFRRFPLKQVPLYMVAQVLGSILGSGTLVLIFDSDNEHFFGTTPIDTATQTFVLEIVITFILMFVISGVATDSRAIGSMAGLAVGGTITMNVFMAGPVSGASMNPSRTLGPALIFHIYKGLWAYMVGPFIGAILGGFAYNMIRRTDKPLRELTKSNSFIASCARR
ncbi:hypothetical protein ACET3Z_032060 [Daucus carota]